MHDSLFVRKTTHKKQTPERNQSRRREWNMFATNEIIIFFFDMPQQTFQLYPMSDLFVQYFRFVTQSLSVPALVVTR